MTAVLSPGSAELLAAHLAAMRARGQSPATIRGRVAVVHWIAQECGGDLATVSLQVLQRWAARSGWVGWTLRTYVNHARSFFTETYESGRLPANPAARLRPPTRPDDAPHPVSEAELHAILARVTEPWITVITLAAWCGLRAGDIARLRREDVTEDGVHVRHGKGDKSAVLPCHPRVWALLRDRPPGPVITSPTGRPVTSGWLSSRAREQFDALGLPDMCLHRFRHRYATALLRNGANVRVVQRLMRHKSLETTSRYLDVADAELRTAVGAL